MNVNFKSSVDQGKSLFFGKSNDGKKTLLVPRNTVLNNTTLTNNLIIYWDFNQGNANPKFGNPTYILINSGSITYSAGKLGTGINLPINSRVRITQNLWNMIISPTSFSVSLWVKKNESSTSGGATAVIAGSMYGPMAFFFTFSNQNGENADQVLSYAQITGSSQYIYISTNYTVTLGEWIHLVGTYDLGSQTMRFYVNGNLVGTQNNVTPPTNTPQPNWNGFAINGSTIDTAGSEYGGNQSFDMVGLWNRTLTTSEVQNLYNNNNGLEL